MPSLTPSCQPAASVAVTTVGMISTIFGIRRVVNSIRAGIDMLPMIGPRTSPRNRSTIVHAAPPATWKNSSGHSLLDSIAAISSTATTATTTSPRRGTISKSGRSSAAGGACSASIAVVGIAVSVI